MPKPRRNWAGLAVAAAAGAAIALPAGMMIGAGPDRHTDSSRSQPGNAVAESRNLYSPRIGSDPFVIAQQERVAEALELSCRQSNAHCDEARQARLRINEAKAGR